MSADAWRPRAVTESLQFVPATCGLSHLRDAVESARSCADTGALIVVLFHDYDFQESRSGRGVITFDQFEETLDWIAAQEDVRVRSMHEISDADVVRYMKFRNLRRIQYALPRSLRGSSQPWVYWSEEGIHRVIRRSLGILVKLYGTIMLSVAVLSCVVALFARAVMSASVWRVVLLLG